MKILDLLVMKGYLMSILAEVLEEEYDRSIRLSNALQKEINDLPNGSLQKKNINGKDYWYLQYREGKKIKSKYIKSIEVEEMKEKIAKRKENIEALKEQRQIQNQLSKALGKDFVYEYAAKAIS